MINYDEIFSENELNRIFPLEISDQFFDALLGDATEGAYDIRLKFVSQNDSTLHFLFELHQRKNKCLGCSLTYGLPQVFNRHPIINIKGLIKKIELLMNGHARCLGFQLGQTKTISSELHAIPLMVTIEK